jgi:hypothetical protein
MIRYGLFIFRSKESKVEIGECIRLGQDGDQWCAVVNSGESWCP